MLLWLRKNLYLAIALAAMASVIAGQAAFSLRQADKMGGLKEQVRTTEASLESEQLAHAELKLGYDSLQRSLTAALEEIKVSATEQEVAVSQIRDLSARLTESGVKLRAERDKIYLEPNCNALAKLDVAAMCPNLGFSLRQRAARSSSAP